MSSGPPEKKWAVMADTSGIELEPQVPCATGERALAHRLQERGVLLVGQLRTDAGLGQVANHGLRVLAVAVSEKIELEAVGKAGFLQQRLGLGGIVGVLRHLLRAAELVGMAG